MVKRIITIIIIIIIIRAILWSSIFLDTKYIN